MNENLFLASGIKIARARENLNRLELEFHRFFESKPYRIQHEYNLETREILLVYYPEIAIPTNWLAIIGEILFNLRSCLDLAVYELTELEQGRPLEKTEFPVFEEKELFFQRKKMATPPLVVVFIKSGGFDKRQSKLLRLCSRTTFG